MGWGEIAIWVIAAFFVLVTFANPAGLAVGVLLAVALIASYYGIPYLGALVRDRQRGKSAAKADRSVRKKLRGGEK